jgi:ABC-type antimicrobial peptide transport system permease subunit
VALLKTSLDEATVARWIRSQIGAVDPSVPVKIEPMAERVSGMTARQRFVAALVGLFAGFGLLLAAIGLYGVLAFLVAQRTREIGVRMAIGATPGKIAGMMQKQAAAWTVSGIVVGLAASAALGRLARSFLFQVSPYDPVSLAIATGVLAAVAGLAAWWPARRAAMVDPAISLRNE